MGKWGQIWAKKKGKRALALAFEPVSDFTYW
jgi:hypothetical protein